MNVFFVVVLVAVIPLAWLFVSLLYVKYGKNENIKQMLQGGLGDGALTILVAGEILVFLIWICGGFQ